jgi:16S rRNA G966 N2-methylase RsmD
VDTGKFDIIFLDPPFGSPLLDQCLMLLEGSALVGPDTLIYVESAIPLLEEALPSQWELLKQQKAGAVFYHLIRSG